MTQTIARFRHHLCYSFLMALLLSALMPQTAQASGNYQRPDSYTNTIAQISTLVNGYVTSNDIVGLSLVLVDTNGIIWSQGFGWADREASIPTSGDTIYRLASLSKLFATIGTLREQELGHLQIDDPISDCMNGFAPIPRPDNGVPPIDYTQDPVTVRDMLCHLSGIQNAYTPYSETSEVYTNFLAINIPSASTDYGCLPPHFLVCYNNNGYQFAEYLITLHNSDGLSYSDYIQRYFFTPLGMTNTGFDMDALVETGNLAASYDYAHDRGAREYMNCLGTGGALSSANDMARFLQMIMLQGSTTVGRVLSPESVTAMLQDQTTDINLYVGNKSLATGLGWDSAVLPDLEYAGGGCSKFGAIFTYGLYTAIATNHQLGVFVGLNTPQSDIATSVGNALLQEAIEEKTGLTPPTATLPVSAFTPGDHQALADSLAGYYVNGAYSTIDAGTNCLMYMGQNLYLRDDGWWAASNSPTFLLGFTNEQGYTFSVMKQPSGCYLDTTVTGLRYTPPASMNSAWSNRLDTLWLIANLPNISYNRTHEGLIAGRLWTTNGMLILTLPNIFLGQADKGFDCTSDYVIEAHDNALAMVQGCGYTIPGGIQMLDGGQRFRATNYEWQNTDTMALLSAGTAYYFVPRANSITWFAFNAETNKQYTLELGNDTVGTFMFTDANGNFLGNSTTSGTLCWICPETGRYYVGINFEDEVPAAATLTLYADTDNIVITATAGSHGTVEPFGSFFTNSGATLTFTFSADTYWDVASVLTNGSDTGLSGISSFTWTNIQSDAQLTVSFAAQTTISNTPLWWLAQYGWTNNVEAAAAGDQDGDGLLTWQEYQYSTCPTNANTDADQYNDGTEALSGADPTRNDTQTYGAILGDSETFNLYTSNNVGDLAFNYAMVAVTSNSEIRLSLQPKTEESLASGTWTNVGDPLVWDLPAATNKAFYRIQGFSE
jgi:CubicO group peptidase (beta-lactamase class C family)